MSLFVTFFENLYYRPKWYHWPVALLLLPLSTVYASVMWIRRVAAKPKNFGIPIISVGNLLVGGSGKTPMTIEFAKRFEDAAVVLRGYGRRSEGLFVVSEHGKILVDVNISGDEAMLLAKSLPKATVIVAEDRLKAIERAKKMGAKVVFLDDGFTKVGIEKFDILLYPPKTPNMLPLPSGPFREFPFANRYADLILREGEDFWREVSCEGCDAPMLLVTAIANPKRLEPYLPKESVVGRMLLPDHSWFDKESIEKEMKKVGAKRLLVTQKDAVKLEPYGFDMALLKLRLRVDPKIFETLERWVEKSDTGK